MNALLSLASTFNFFWPSNASLKATLDREAKKILHPSAPDPELDHILQEINHSISLENSTPNPSLATRITNTFNFNQPPNRDLKRSGANIPPLSSFLSKLKPQGSLTLIPPLFHFLYTSEEKCLHPISIDIEPSFSQTKSYQIAFGKNNLKEGIAFKATCGEPLALDLLKSDQYDACVKDAPIYNTSGHLTTSNQTLGPLSWRNYIFKRLTHIVQCKIILNDPANPSLKNGPMIYTLYPSSCESIQIVHQDPFVKALVKTSTQNSIIPFQERNPRDFASITPLSITLLSGNRDERITLPGFEDENGAFIEIKVED